MLRLCLMVSLWTIVLGGPIPNNPINTTIFNIEQFFEHSLGNLAGTLISHHKPNSTEHYQSSDGSVQAEVEPINLSLLQGIAFHPSNHQLIVEQATTLFNNATEEVDLIKVDLAPSNNDKEIPTTITTATEATTPSTTTITTNPVATSSNVALKEIPTTIVSGTTTTTTEATTSSSSTTTTTTSAPTTKSVSVVIVTAVTEAATTAVSNATTQAAEPSTTDDISVKIKEVEAEPVILSSGV